MRVSALLVLSELCVVPVADADSLRDIGLLQIKAWAAAGPLPGIFPDPATGLDDHDTHGLHWACMADGRIVAAARLCVHQDAAELPDQPSLAGFLSRLPPPAAAYTRLVVDPDFRGRGCPAFLDAFRLRAAISAECRTIVVVTHHVARAAELIRDGFWNAGESLYRTAPEAPSHVFIRNLSDQESVPC
jgi:GNAT superfamily N-acetyltransferase